MGRLAPALVTAAILLLALEPVVLAQQPTPTRHDSRPRFTPADVQFMTAMIFHHAQALEMTNLVPERANHESIRQLALRITISQKDEISLMRHWLEDRGQAAPDLEAHHQHQDSTRARTLMPGMLTDPEMEQLGAAKGTEFDRLFLEFMIRHHEGALTMVARLFATPGAAQEAEVFRFASDVDTDQRAEIQRMRKLLEALN